ncbi:MAG: N-6 DNA methylase [Planctomycetaceae bacterium]|jgi:predicted helicase|nr:N-6 DNA methylase [Planctomycetaceae bacterium]
MFHNTEQTKEEDNIVAIIDGYITEIGNNYKSGKATEHTYRPALQRLLENITEDWSIAGLSITNEPKRIACGSPDYIITRNEIPLGYIEAKDIGVDPDSKTNKEQLDRYKLSLNNLIITDYLNFKLFQNGELTFSVTIGSVENNSIKTDTTQYAVFLDLIRYFVHYRSEDIVSTKQLSKVMAIKARFTASIIEKILEEEDDDEQENDYSLLKQLEGFREVLIHGMSKTMFADMYSQTIAYGMFAARLNDLSGNKFTRSKAAELVPHSNMFLQKLFQYIAGSDLDRRISWAVDALADLFNFVDIKKILEEFSQSTHDLDPVIHFYETFLAEYDPALRKSRGVWYTPLPAVQFIVHSVDEILKQEFNLPQGLADTSTIKLKQKTEQKDDKIKENIVEYHKVQILDPASGTGTFLAEIIKSIHRQFKDQQGLWNGYVHDHLIPRLNGFEILMAPYVMAHLRLDMLLRETGYQFVQPDNYFPKRLRIFLTNSLEEARPKTTNPFAQWLSNEANSASSIKSNVPVMVVLGNPPYSGESINKSKWIEMLLRDYKKEPTGEKLREKNPKWINDDYVKFIRYGQYFIEKNGEGILAYINNHSFLDNPTFRGMRWNLLQKFDKIYIVNLHGNTKKNETTPDGSKDENIFDIQQGVSINILIKNKHKKKDELADVFYFDLYGKRNEKYKFLFDNNISSVKWNQLRPQVPQYFFVLKKFAGQKEYKKGFSIKDLFPVNSAGIVTARDHFTIQLSKQKLKETIKDFISCENKTVREKYDLGKDAQDWSVSDAKKDLTSHADFNHITPINYRPFDIRYTFYTGHSNGFHCRPRGEVMQHFLKGENIGLMVCRQQKTNGFYHCLIHNNIVESGFVSNKTSEIGYSFPLYLYPSDNLMKDHERCPNLNKNIVKKIADRLGLKYTDEKIKSKKSFAPIDLLDYIYAVLHSPAYRKRYKEFFKIDFPRIPYPRDTETFWSLVTLGTKLRHLHLLEKIKLRKGIANYPIRGTNKIEKFTYSDNKVYINEKQYFDHVPPEAYEFQIGCYQPAQKWLKDRCGQILKFEDIQHYQKIITVLRQTIEIQKHIDKISW